MQGLDPETSAEVTIQSNPDLQAQRQRTKKSKPGQAPSHAAGLMAFSKPVNQPPGQKSAYVQGTSYSPWNSNLATMPTSFFNPAHQSPHLASLYHGTVHHPAAGPGQLDQGYQGYAANFPSSGVPAHQTSANHGIPFPPRGLRQDRSYVPPSSSMRDPVYPPGQLPAARVPVYPGYGDTAAVPERGLAAPFPPHQAALPNATPARPASMGVGMNQCHCTLCGNIFQPGHVCYR